MDKSMYNLNKYCRDQLWGMLLGTHVRTLAVSVGEEHLKINDFIISTDADCCSETWFADITGVDLLLNNVIIGVEILEYENPLEDGRTRQEFDQHYGVRLLTKEGSCFIVYRNSSNGYYGGNVCPFNFQYKKIEEVEWVNITNDWHA